MNSWTFRPDIGLPNIRAKLPERAANIKIDLTSDVVHSVHAVELVLLGDRGPDGLEVEQALTRRGVRRTEHRTKQANGARAHWFSFDFPDAGSTRAQGIDANGNIVGFYTKNATDNTNARHGFLLRGATFTAIDFPGAGSTEAWRINDNGEILGRYLSTTDSKWHLYRLSNGSFTAIADFPGAAQTAPDGYGHLGGFNSRGDITSDYCSSTPCQNLFNQTAALGVHGFLLSVGVYTSIDPPGAMGSLALGINDGGDIVGTYRDTSGQFHGYLRTP